ncbi:MAG: DNA-3-methyladenine glycosylase [Gemmatimonadota bacterium]
MRGPIDAAARALLGAVLLSEVDGIRTAGVVVETEAYIGVHDPASHAAARIGRTRRNDSMFGPAGTAYVYRSHGIHDCVNVVGGPVGQPLAVLIRALHPLEGLDRMAARRGRAHDLCSGPGRLCQALHIRGSLDGHDLGSPPLRLLQGWTVPASCVGTSGRVGVSRAADWPLRFFVRGESSVSRGRVRPPRRGTSFRRALLESVAVAGSAVDPSPETLER